MVVKSKGISPPNTLKSGLGIILIWPECWENPWNKWMFRLHSTCCFLNDQEMRFKLEISSSCWYQHIKSISDIFDRILPIFSNQKNYTYIWLYVFSIFYKNPPGFSIHFTFIIGPSGPGGTKSIRKNGYDLEIPLSRWAPGGLKPDEIPVWCIYSQ